MKIPRLTKSIFLDQFIYMQLVGVLIGLAFPHFLVWYGFATEQVLTTEFYILTQVAGQVVGLISFLMISLVIRPHLKTLSNKMQDIAININSKDFLDYSEKCNENMCAMEVVSNDEIGISASAYNELLNALMSAHETEQVFNKFSKIMSESLEVQTLSEETVDLLIGATRIEAAAIYLFKNGEIELTSTRGITDADKLTKHPSVMDAVNKGRAQKINLPKHVQLDGVLTHFTPSEVFIEPIDFKGTHLGVMVAATGALMADEKTRVILQLFSRSMGLALNNALIHSKFQRLAAYDSLTNVYNRRFGMARLKEDFARSTREQSSLSVIMVDIDHFKNINDTYGHLVGDKAIVIIASILKNISRDGDVVVRYGGEEFLMILPGASSADAAKVAERIRHQVKDTIFKEDNQQIVMTISVGVCGYPEIQVTDEVELIDKADQALYHAKQSGRNRVVEFARLKNIA
ncbi:GGDEF domain-containing protein [Thiomicrorhabdus sediminis]|uniref:diguanylate cyclase n=1 Tax=Thiomicrorhabdus sediminis TaxID=2580412 RepID=A0A4P9K2Y4_9GAMM|nr:GGDEF domain-containing protein [Thiomicrorhabdus sediminis]QCU89212.1 GGDEF domain-containing protein [Thiomicrorhabdus sediminis]